MATTRIDESTLTERYQTTIPAAVRRALNLGKHDKIRYAIQSNGKVVITRAESIEDDPVVGNFLGFLATDMANHPERIQLLDTGLAQHIRSLVGNVEVDLDTPLPKDNE
ncbi:MAG: type II toxin-antitoxin system PrlF family antitoxin [Nitrospirota bacterium]|nr:type II toxin-antitoxin system PrlF family antitoxin [Nitrospirota bacterium]